MQNLLVDKLDEVYHQMIQSERSIFQSLTRWSLDASSSRSLNTRSVHSNGWLFNCLPAEDSSHPKWLWVSVHWITSVTIRPMYGRSLACVYEPPPAMIKLACFGCRTIIGCWLPVTPSLERLDKGSWIIAFRLTNTTISTLYGRLWGPVSFFESNRELLTSSECQGRSWRHLLAQIYPLSLMDLWKPWSMSLYPHQPL